MGKKQSPSPKADYSAALTEAKTPLPVQAALQTMALNDLTTLGKGDYTNLPKDIFFNLADPAQRKRQRDLQYNAGNQGIFALGKANPTALALGKQNLAAHDAQDDAAAYEQNVREGANRAFATAGDLASMDQARKLGILGITSGPYMKNMDKKSWWEKLLAGASAGAGSAAMFV